MTALTLTCAMIVLTFTHIHTYTQIHTIGEPPSLPSKLQEVFVFKEDADGNPVNLEFNCQAEGNPPPNITW